MVPITSCSLALEGTFICVTHIYQYTMWTIYDPTVSEPKQENDWDASAWQSSTPFLTLITSACDRDSQLGQADRLEKPGRWGTKQRCWSVHKTSLEFLRIWLVSEFYRLRPNSRQERRNRSCPRVPSASAPSPAVLTPWHLLSPGTCVWGYGNADARPPAGSPAGSVPHGEALRCPQSLQQAVQLAEGAHQTPQYPLGTQILGGGEGKRDPSQGTDGLHNCLNLSQAQWNTGTFWKQTRRQVLNKQRLFLNVAQEQQVWQRKWVRLRRNRSFLSILTAPRLISATRTKAKILRHRLEFLSPSTDSELTGDRRHGQPLRGPKNPQLCLPPSARLRQENAPPAEAWAIRPLSYMIPNNSVRTLRRQRSNISPQGSVLCPEQSLQQRGRTEARRRQASDWSLLVSTHLLLC